MMIADYLIKDEKMNLAGHLSAISDAMFEVVLLAEEAGQVGKTPLDEIFESTMRILNVLKLYQNLVEEIAELDSV